MLNPALSEELASPSCVALRDAYLIRCVLPIAELAEPKEYGSEGLIEALCVHLLWCLYWRSLDTLLDDRARPTESVEDLAQVLCTAVQANTQLRARLASQTPLDLSHVLEPCSIYRRETEGSTEIDDIWRRASPFLIVPESILHLAPKRLDAYKAYLNLFGLVHDAQDLMSDIRQGLESLPIRWLREIDPDLQLRPRTLGLYYRRAADAIAELTRQTKAQFDGSERELFDVLLKPVTDVCIGFESASRALSDSN